MIVQSLIRIPESYDFDYYAILFPPWWDKHRRAWIALRMDVPLPKTIRIGNASVGLIGLEAALYAVLEKTVSDEQAAAELFAAVRKQNYIPENAAPLYKQALLEEYRRHRYQTGDADHGLVIRVLGRPCISCNKLKIMVIEILDKLHLAADVEDVQDLDEIWRYGVMKTPALIINNVVKSAGRLPTMTQVEQWLWEEKRSRDGNK